MKQSWGHTGNTEIGQSWLSWSFSHEAALPGTEAQTHIPTRAPQGGQMKETNAQPWGKTGGWGGADITHQISSSQTLPLRLRWNNEEL